LRRFLGSPWAQGRYTTILILGDGYMIETASPGGAAMTEHDIFVSTDSPAGVVRAVIEAALGTAFKASQDAEPVPVLVIGTTRVFFHDSHLFEDDQDFAVSRYRCWVSVEDSARDAERQLAIAQQVFDALKAEGWPVMLSFDLQGSLAVYP
jgi:hypothetical protein